ncbi:tetratricopeptide repeat protein, partial [Pseudomonas aeruginosa]
MLAQAEQKLGRPQAEADYRAVLARQPGNGGAAIGLADLLAKSGRTDEALA